MLNVFGNLILEANLRMENNYSGSMWPGNSTRSDSQVKTTGSKLRFRAEFWISLLYLKTYSGKAEATNAECCVRTDEVLFLV